MTLEEANDIISDYEYWEDKSCTCFRGNICLKCVEQPTEKLYNEAIKVFLKSEGIILGE